MWEGIIGNGKKKQNNFIEEDLDMKLKVAAILSVCVMLMTGMQVNASGIIHSVSTGTGGIVSASPARGSAELSDKFDDPELQNEVDQINGSLNKNLAEALGKDELELYNSKTKVISLEKLSDYKFLTKISNLTIQADPMPSVEQPISIDLVCNSITSNIQVYVLHKCELHGWELLDTVTSGNIATAVFHSASPVALVYRDKEQGKSGETGVSPKTGEDGMELIAVIAAVLFIGLGTCSVMHSKKIRGVKN